MIIDLPGVLKRSNLSMYAYDTTVHLCGVNQQELQWKLQEDLDRVSKWLKNHKLSLNIGKTNFMILGTKQRVIVQGDNPTSCKFNGNTL